MLFYFFSFISSFLYMNNCSPNIQKGNIQKQKGVSRHQPKDYSTNKKLEMEITTPEISQAIFNELKNNPDIYFIESDKEFNAYIGITSFLSLPKNEIIKICDECDDKIKFNIDILDNNKNIIKTLNGEDFEWWPWYESYGKKWYCIGPEFGEDFKHNAQLPAGKYYIKVYNTNNTGKYCLTVGDIEKFSILDYIKIFFSSNKFNKYWE